MSLSHLLDQISLKMFAFQKTFGVSQQYIQVFNFLFLLVTVGKKAKKRLAKS